MGQKDPLAEWQREGFDMFEAMMGQIQDTFVAGVTPPGRGRGRAASRPPRRYGTTRPTLSHRGGGDAGHRSSMTAEGRVGDLDARSTAPSTPR